jgi:type I restriction enzyme M protein
MLGAIIGDMVGSTFEFHPIKTKDFNIFNKLTRMTDDSYLTIAVAKVLLKHYPIKYDEESLNAIKKDLIKEFVYMWKVYPQCGFGGMFFRWCYEASQGIEPKPYNSYGNGSAMRISPVAWIAKTEEELKLLSKTVTEITHNHPEGIKGAEAVAMSIFMALHGASKDEIKERMIKEYYPEIAALDFDDLVKHYEFSEICQKSVPQAIYCFLISDSLEDTVRNCVAIGGDCDTTGAMAGAIAEAYYQKDKVSPFEDKFLYLMIDPSVENLIKELHKTIGSHKFDKLSK